MTDPIYLVAEADWWRQAVIYQIYPRSFADANGDGIGDLQGITSKVPYLQKLGVDAVWLSPFYPSPLKDGGYDVADYRDVDPRIGTLRDFDEMVAAFKAAGIRIMIDIVPNHTSDEHAWFQAALKAKPGSKERERYIFREGLGPNKDQPPNDWQSVFGGSAWEPSGQDDGYFYHHIFVAGQPCLNWDNAEVREDFLETLRFWGKRGVSGFRVDAASACVKDMSEPYPSWQEMQDRLRRYSSGELGVTHPWFDQDGVHDVYREWRKVFNEFSPPLMAVAEAWVPQHRKVLYAAKDGLGQAFSFDLTVANYDADDFRRLIEQGLVFAEKSGASTTWVLSNHDLTRHVTRYGLPSHAHGSDMFAIMQYFSDSLVGGKSQVDLEKGTRRARSALMLLLGLPGSTYLYQGEELGLPEVIDIPDAERQDPVFINSRGAALGRDGCRVPIPWQAGDANFGYTSGKPHLPMPDWFADFAVDHEESEKDSMLNFYRLLIGLRKSLQTHEKLDWLVSPKGVLRYCRPNGWEVAVNFGADPVEIPMGCCSSCIKRSFYQSFESTGYQSRP